MKILYIGGQKSGKTSLAIGKALSLSKNQNPFYLATYINSYNDAEMQKRVDKHKIERQEKFITIEEGLNLIEPINQNSGIFLIDCVSMWIFNKLENEKDNLIEDMSEILKIDKDIIFILNDVSSGIIPINKLSREFVDFSGIIGQLIAKNCDEVYSVTCGLLHKLK